MSFEGFGCGLRIRMFDSFHFEKSSVRLLVNRPSSEKKNDRSVARGEINDIGTGSV